MSDNSPDRQNYIQQGHAAAWIGAWDQAVDFYRQAYESNPNDPKIAQLLAFSLFELGDLENSLRYYDITTQLLPDDPVPLEKIGLIHERQGRKLESIQAYEKSAAFFLKKENPLRAANCLQHILLQNPEHIDAHAKLASINNNTSLDLSDLSRFFDEQPSQPLPGASQSTKIKQDPLVEAHEKALTALALLWFELASSRKNKKTDPGNEADTPQTDIRHLSEDPECLVLLNHLNRATEYLARGMANRYLLELQTLLQAGINNPAIHFLTGSLLSDSKANQALSHLKQTRSHPDYALASYLLIGKMYYVQKNYPEAAAAYLQALAVADSSNTSQADQNKQPVFFKPLIQAYARETNTLFLKNLCETIEMEINSAYWRDQLAALHSQISTGKGSGDIMLAELLAAGGSPLVQRFADVKELEDDDHSRSAMEEIFNMIEDGPVLLPAQMLIAESLGKQGYTDEAVQKLKLAARLYALRGQIDQATQALEQAVTLSPLDVAIRLKLINLLKRSTKMGLAVEQTLKLAEIYYQLAEPEKAHQILAEVTHFTQTSTTGKGYSLALLNKDADLFMQDLQFQQACETYEQILKIYPADITANVRVAVLNHRLGRREIAKQKMNAFILFLNENQKADQVEQYLINICEELPDVLEIHKQLADWYHKHGKKDQTIEQLNIIANQLLKKGKYDAAVIVLKTIVTLNPPEMDKYQQIINKISHRA